MNSESTTGNRIAKRTGAVWSVHEDEALIACFQAGRSLEQLVEWFYRSPAAICTRLARYDLLIYVPRKGTYHKIDPKEWT